MIVVLRQLDLLLNLYIRFRSVDSYCVTSHNRTQAEKKLMAIMAHWTVTLLLNLPLLMFGQITHGFYVDMIGTDSDKKCAELELKEDSLFHMYLFDQKGNHWRGKQIIRGIYSTSGDSLHLVDTLVIAENTEKTVQATRHTFFFLNDNRQLLFLKESFDNEINYRKRAKEVYAIKDDSPLLLPSLKTCGLLTWKP